MNSLDDLLRVFWSRPAYQRVFLAFTVGLFLSCAARVAQSQPATHNAVTVIARLPDSRPVGLLRTGMSRGYARSVAELSYSRQPSDHLSRW